MRLESFRAKGFGPFAKEFSVDLSELRGLVAVVGKNGAGKSTFLELALPGAMHRNTPTRGTLAELAVSRDACLEVKVVNGQPWTIKHLVDSVSGKSETLVLDAAGVPALPDSKVRSFDAWSSRHLPVPEVLMATIFGAQGAGGFLAAKPAERKAILLRVLGVQRLEDLAKLAGEQLRVGRANLATLDARVADERARGGDVASLTASLKAARAAVAEAEENAAYAQQRLAETEEACRAVKITVTANRQLKARAIELGAQCEAARTAAAGLAARLTNNRAVLADAEKIREAVAEAGRLERQRATLHADSAVADAEANRLIEPWADIEQRKTAVQQRAARAKARLADADIIQQAKAAIGALSQELGGARAEVASVTLALEELHATRLAGADERIGDLRYALTTASEQQTYDATHQAVHDGLDKDDMVVEAARAVPLRTSELRERLTTARDHLAVVERQHQDAARLAARAGDLDGAEEELTAAQRELAALETGRVAAATAAHEKRREAENLASQATSVSEQLKSLAPLVAKAAPLANAEVRVAELEPQLADADSVVDRLRTALAALPQPAPELPAPNLLLAQAYLKERTAAVVEAHRVAAQLEQQLAQAVASTEQLRELEQARSIEQDELADWHRLTADLGKDGLQALEIDAAGPELTDLTNALLHEAHGPRFTVRIETQRASADGKRMLEGCEVMVLDTEAGREAEGGTFSGGEKVILSEAIALAISTLACRRSGLTDISLVRDESGAALDASNARVYVAMLRKAVEMIGARHCLLVSHVPEVQELCDHRIEVGS